jgi:uncharacterized membrane protein
MMYGTNGVTGMTGTMGSWGLLIMMVMLVVLVLAVLGGVWLYRRLSNPDTGRAHHAALAGGGPAGRDPAHRRLRERYSAGEIDDDEYERRLSALNHWH